MITKFDFSEVYYIALELFEVIRYTRDQRESERRWQIQYRMKKEQT